MWFPDTTGMWMTPEAESGIAGLVLDIIRRFGLTSDI